MTDHGCLVMIIEFVYPDAENNVAIDDNGIGMSREEVIENLGTIAKSGTADFMDQLMAIGNLTAS